MSAEARTRISLRWRDMDMLGHLNQAVYHELLEEGRGALFASLGGAAWFPFVLVRVELDYRSEVRHDHEHGRGRRARRAGRHQERDAGPRDRAARRHGRGERAARVIVAWDPQARGSRALTEGERAALLT